MDFVDKRPTVVITDGSPTILAMLSKLLQPSFSIVAQAEDGDGAFKAITEFHPQLAILDLTMRKISGFEVARRLSKAQSSTKIVFLDAVRNVPEVCSIFCATANSVEIIVAQSEQGRGVLGVIDGNSPKGVEGDTDIVWRHDLLRKIGYKR